MTLTYFPILQGRHEVEILSVDLRYCPKSQSWHVPFTSAYSPSPQSGLQLPILMWSLTMNPLMNVLTGHPMQSVVPSFGVYLSGGQTTHLISDACKALAVAGSVRCLPAVQLVQNVAPASDHMPAEQNLH